MKFKELAKYGIDSDDFMKWIHFSPKYGKYVKEGFASISLDDNADVMFLISEYKKERFPDPKEVAAAKAAKEAEEMRKKQAMADMLISSGFNFEGYTITKYSGYISGDDVIQIDRGMAGIFTKGSSTNPGKALTDALSEIRRNAIRELKEAAYDLGCNAIIGVDFDYITLEPETANYTGGTTYLPYVFCVTANGNAVVIEKKKEKEDTDTLE